MTRSSTNSLKSAKPAAHYHGRLPRALQLFIDRFGEPTFAAARQRRKEDMLVFIAAAQLRRKIPFNQLSLRLQRDLRSFFGSYANAEEKAREIMFTAGDSDELEIAVAQLGFGHLDDREGHFTIHRSLLDELPVILRIYVECAARLYGDPREADLIKIHLHSRKLTFHYYRDFEKFQLPELVTRIKIDLRRLFVSVIDHSIGPEHQLLFFKERFLAKDHPDRPKIDRFSAKLGKLGLREETIGYGPTKEKWEAFLKLERGIHPA